MWIGYPVRRRAESTRAGRRAVDYRPLGRSGVLVSRMCLGAMMFGAFGNRDHDDAIRIIHKALDAGINFIDTADGVDSGVQCLMDDPDRVVVITVAEGAEHHRTQAHAADQDAGASEGSVVHSSSPCSCRFGSPTNRIAYPHITG